MEPCLFCKESDSYNQISQRTIFETENFRAFASFGQIIEGYVLIAPKDHYSCMGTVPEKLFPEYVSLKNKVEKSLTKNYSKPLFMEHGIIGQTVYHAHVHAIPVNKRPIMTEPLDYQFNKMKTIKQESHIRTFFEKEGVYFYYEYDGEKYAYSTDIFPGYGRTLVAKELGVPNRADWKDIDKTLDATLIDNTIKKLKK